MIILDVEVPMVDKRYDVQIDEKLPMAGVKVDIATIICQKEQCLLGGDAEQLSLWDVQRESRIIEEKSALENGLCTGNRIMIL